jgi:hypothetical protein
MGRNQPRRVDMPSTRARSRPATVTLVCLAVGGGIGVVIGAIVEGIDAIADVGPSLSAVTDACWRKAMQFIANALKVWLAHKAMRFGCSVAAVVLVIVLIIVVAI